MKFILTKELGRLAKWLRILGFDAGYFTDSKESSLIIEALRQDRVILTRKTRLGQHPGIKKLFLASDNIDEQLWQVIRQMSIKLDEKAMFSRCTICNEPLIRVEKTKVKEKIPEYIFKTQNDFFACPECLRVYWQGSHWGNVTKILDKIRGHRE